jgi:hypothetical protein
MRTRRYSWRLHTLDKTLRVIVYADRSIDIHRIDHYGSNDEIQWPSNLRTRQHAAEVLDFARHEYTVEKEYL